MSEVSGKRIRKFKAELIKEIPLFPNNRATKEDLESKSLTEVLVAYLNWKSRQIRPNKRKSIIAPNVTSSPHWSVFKDQVKKLIALSEAGEDINPYLSLGARDEGFTVIKDGEDLWQDKDQILNTKGIYHFHLSDTKMPKGHMDRTNELLFAYVSRNELRTLGFYTHDVFIQQGSGNIHPERSKLLEEHCKVVEFGMEPGSVYIESPIATSGHTLNSVSMAIEYVRVIEQYDSELDDYQFLQTLFGENVPKKHKLCWYMHYTNLCVYDSVSNQVFILKKGLN